MLKVMLVDDDVPVLQFLKQCIPWESLQLELIGMFENGVKAYEHAKLECPDLLITDIGMPQMNGIELIELLKEMNPQLQTVILSCHDDFKYAQQAIKLHVNDYLLKEMIEPENVVELMEQLIKKHREVSEHGDKLANFQHAHRWIMKEQFIRYTLFHPVWDEEQWNESARQFGLDITTQPYIPVLGYINQYDQAKSKFISEENCIFAIENIIEELLGEEQHAFSFRVSMQEILILYEAPNSLHVNIYDLIKQSLQHIQFSIKKYLKLDLSFIIGETQGTFQTLRRNILALVNSKQFRFYHLPATIYNYKPILFTQDDLFSHYSKALEQFQSHIMTKEQEKTESLVDHWLGWIQSEKYNPEIVKEWFLKLLLDLQMKFKSMQYFNTQYSQEVLHQTFQGVDLAQLKKVVIHFMNEAIAFTSQMERKGQRVEIWEAKRYVAMNLHRKLTLDEVAGHLHLNSSYFSRLYKKETNENFIEFVIRSKMEKAMELMDQSPKTIDEIADSLGYDNKSYFNKLFKSFANMTPSEYRTRFQTKV